MQHPAPSSVTTGPVPIRLIGLGDEILAGVGDARALGWLGRAVATEQGSTPRIELFTSAMPGQTSASLASRWEREVMARYDERGAESGTREHRVVVGLGHGDLDAEISLARTRLNLAKVLDGLERLRIPAFVVGPPPSRDRQRTAAIRDLSGAYEDVCSRRRVPFVDTVAALDGHEQWTGDLARTGSDIPAQTGYGLMAWLVLHGGFGRWLGTES
jgi:acyl-CoA thioesterase-1